MLSFIIKTKSFDRAPPHTEHTMMKQGKPVYVRDEESTWAPALQVHSSGNRAVVVRPVFKTEQQMLQCGDKQKYTKEETVDLASYSNKVLPMQNVDASGNLEDYKDMVALPYLHEVRYLLDTPSRFGLDRSRCILSRSKRRQSCTI